MIALQKKIELDKLDTLAASKYVEHRKRIHSNNNPSNSSKEPNDLNSLKSKRMMYSFNKLNDASVITIVNNHVPKAEEEERQSSPCQMEGSSIGSNGILKNRTVVFSQSNNYDRASFKGKRATFQKNLRAASIDVSPGHSWHYLSTSRVNSIKSENNNHNNNTNIP